MAAVIRKPEKNKIMILGGITGLIGAAAGSMGIYLRLKVIKEGSWEEEWIPQFTDGFFGVMSGFSLFLLGTLGNVLIYPRSCCLVFLYGFLSLACDVLCVLDVLMVLPYTKWHGDLAWNDQPLEICKTDCIILDAKTVNATSQLHGIHLTEYCASSEIIGTLFICITTAVMVGFLLSTITTAVTCVGLCRARAILPPDQPGVHLEPFSPPYHIQPGSYDNKVHHDEGFRK